MQFGAVSMTYFVVQQDLWVVWMLKEAEKIIRRNVAEGDPKQLFCSGFVTKTSQIVPGKTAVNQPPWAERCYPKQTYF